MNAKIEQKIEQIAECILDKINEARQDKIGGLYDGEFGILLFLFYYSKYKNNKEMENITNNYAENLLDKIGESSLHTFCGGLAGILYLFEILQENDLVNIDIKEAKDTLDIFFINRMRNDMKLKNYDFLHGALGVGYYFLKTRSNDKILLELIDYLNDTAEVDDNKQTAKWKSIIDPDVNFQGYNISLSHGMSSIVLFLSKSIKQKIKHSRTKKLLEQAINYILQQEIDYKKYGSYFPNFSIESSGEISGSRLAWCYGDLGIAYALWYAGRIVNNKEWENKGFNILLHSTERRTLGESKIIDVGICHGTMSMVLIYRRMYIETSDKIFLEATEYWMKKSLDLAKFKDGLANFKTYYDQKWIQDYSLLTGISGIGLLLISYLIKDINNWDEIFLL